MNTMRQVPIPLGPASGPFLKRVTFDAWQRENPRILMPAFDPDPPIKLLDGLEKFDPLIMTLLKRNLPLTKGAGQPVPLPKAGVPKAACLAKKLASGHPDLTEKQLDNLAARIGWLLRNWFRHDARDGYDLCLKGKKPRPKKLSASATKTRTSPPQPGAKGTNLPQPAAPQIAPPPPLAQAADTSSPMPSSGDLEEQFDEAGKGETRALLELFGTQNQRVSSAPNLAEVAPADEDDFTFGVRSIGGPNLSIQPDAIAVDRAEWQREIEEVRTAGVPLDPPPLKTFAKEFPISKAQAFFLAVWRAKGLSEQAIDLGKELAADHAALSATIAANKSAKDDVINWFAFLGIDLC